jgi:hypothetical protein
MELMNITTDSNFLVYNKAEDEVFSTSSKSEINKNVMNKKSFMYSEEQEKYYKESIIINYQRYKAMFRTALIGNILIDDKYIIRDINKKAKDEFSQILGTDIKIGTSVSYWFNDSHQGSVFLKALKNSLNEVMEFELIGIDGKKHRFQIEMILFINPSENRLLKCILAVKIS